MVGHQPVFFFTGLTSSSFPSSHSHSRGSDRNGSHSSRSGGRPLRRLWLPSSSDPSRRKGSRSARSSGLAHSNCQDHSGLEMKILTPITLDWNIMIHEPSSVSISAYHRQGDEHRHQHRHQQLQLDQL